MGHDLGRRWLRQVRQGLRDYLGVESGAQIFRAWPADSEEKAPPQMGSEVGGNKYAAMLAKAGITVPMAIGIAVAGVVIFAVVSMVGSRVSQPQQQQQMVYDQCGQPGMY